MDFKLIAVRALDDCHKDFRKNLKEAYFYKFYRRYRLEDKNGQEIIENGEVAKITVMPSVAENLYHVRTKDGRGLDLNISAIVGKNGSGKSTISELFFATLYIFSVRANLLLPNEVSLEEEVERLDSNSKVFMNNDADRLNYGRIMRILKAGKHTNFEVMRGMFRSYEESLKKDFDTKTVASNRRSEINKELAEILRLRTGLKSEIIFCLSKTFLSLKVSDAFPEGFRITVISSHEENDAKVLEIVRELTLNKIFDAEKFLPGLFFYTVAINYSNYSLNSEVVGKWIQWLFHKNDGYRSPIVINPMRTKGEFSIAKENRFAKYRLLSNLLAFYKDTGGAEKVYLTSHQYVKNVKFTLNEKKITEYTIDDNGDTIKGNQIEIEIVEGLYRVFLPEGSQGDIRAGAGKHIFKLISNYVIQKVKRICENYDGFEYPSTIGQIDSLLVKLKKENSHITFKLKQAIFFIIHNVYPKTAHTFFGDEREVVNEIDLSLEDLFQWMGSPDHGEIINHLPPSIFTIDIELESDSGEMSMFNKLSSGEQQYIHVIQSVLYHIFNLQSVSTAQDRIAYRALNIIFDEVELYFHPEMQRRFINELRNAISNLYLIGKGGITGVNILFLTHSPFILSDIPSENVLRLTVDGEKKAVSKLTTGETFAANINDLLANNFFLDDTLIGAFADDKIVKFIGDVQNNGVNPQSNEFLELIGDEYLRAGLENFLENSRHDKTES